MSDDYEWIPHPPTVRQRIAAGVFVLMLLTACASDYADWRLFGNYDKQAVGVITFVGLILFTRFMPTVRRT